MPLIQELDYGTPAVIADKTVTLTIDGHDVTVPEGTSIMHAAMDAGIKVPKLCATDSLNSFGSCRLCLVEIEGRPGTPASCTTLVAPGMKVHTAGEKVRRIRRGVMELYISDHPLDCLTCSANGNCELQDAAGEVGLRDVRYGYDGANHLQRADRRLQSVFPVRSVEVHRLLALRARVRGSAGHVRADRAGARLRLEDRRRHGRAVPGQRVRLLRRLRAGLPDRDADGKDRGRSRPARAFRGDHLCLLRRRLQLQGRDARRHRRAHGAVEGRQGEPRAFLREGPLRLGLCQPPGPHPEADDAREDHRSVARGVVGRSHRPRRI